MAETTDKPVRRRKSASPKSSPEISADSGADAPASIPDAPAAVLAAASPPVPAAVVPPAPPPPNPDAVLSIHALADLSVAQLQKRAGDDGVKDAYAFTDRHALQMAIIKKSAAKEGLDYAEGVVELMPEGFAFLRNAENSYLGSSDDIYVGPSQARRYALRHGQLVQAVVRSPRENERYFAMLKADAINGLSPEKAATLRHFEDLTPHHPCQRLIMENKPDELDTRIVDILTPIGRGQRALIVAPPRTGKTVLLQKMAKAVITNHPEVSVIVLLIDERPEEVTDFKMSVPKQVEVVASTFDEQPQRHMQVCEMAIEKARRLVESGRHVVVFMDSLTRMARAYNAGQAGSGKILTGGLDANAMQKPKKFFGSARAIEGGGSLTIIATALVETNSKGDEVIFEEFKGTGNAELYLSRPLAEKRVYPAIDIAKSGTRREELLLDPKELQLVHRLRRVLSDMNPADAMELLKSKLAKSPSNAVFLLTMSGDALR